MTEILLEVTEEVIRSVVKDFVFKLKNSRGIRVSILMVNYLKLELRWTML